MRAAAAAALLLLAPAHGSDICIRSYKSPRMQTCTGNITSFTATLGVCYNVGTDVWESFINEEAQGVGFTTDRSEEACTNHDPAKGVKFLFFDVCRVHADYHGELRVGKISRGACPPVAPTPAPPGPPCKDIVALAQSVKDLSTLVTAVVAGGLVDTLKGPGPFTVFAPTNEAFAALPNGTLEKLLKPENKAQLDDILLYHVLPVKVLSTDLKDGETVKTVEGKSVTVHIYPSGAVKINDATVQQVDVLACNGVVHVIDAVLLPPSA